MNTYHYPDFTITLCPFLCAIESGDLIPQEHAELAWMRTEELPHLDWADADRPVVNSLLAMPQEDSE
jgi:8-oxo-dGTP diphosphatase